MTPRSTVPEKVSNWLTAYRAVSEELTPKPLRAALNAIKAEQGVNAVGVAERWGLAVMANDRTAATVAAMLVGQGVRVNSTEEPSE